MVQDSYDYRNLLLCCEALMELCAQSESFLVFFVGLWPIIHFTSSNSSLSRLLTADASATALWSSIFDSTAFLASWAIILCTSSPDPTVLSIFLISGRILATLNAYLAIPVHDQKWYTYFGWWDLRVGLGFDLISSEFFDESRVRCCISPMYNMVFIYSRVFYVQFISWSEAGDFPCALVRVENSHLVFRLWHARQPRRRGPAQLVPLLLHIEHGCSVQFGKITLSQMRSTNYLVNDIVTRLHLIWCQSKSARLSFIRHLDIGFRGVFIVCIHQCPFYLQFKCLYGLWNRKSWWVRGGRQHWRLCWHLFVETRLLPDAIRDDLIRGVERSRFGAGSHKPALVTNCLRFSVT